MNWDRVKKRQLMRQHGTEDIRGYDGAAVRRLMRTSASAQHPRPAKEPRSPRNTAAAFLAWRARL